MNSIWSDSEKDFKSYIQDNEQCMFILKRFYGQREIEFPSAQIVLSDGRQNPFAVSVTILHTSFNKWASS